MTRQEIEKDYTVVDGRIKTPGEFEGEMIYVPAFWESALDGCADRDDGKVFGFNLSADDKKMWPELKGRRTLKLYQRDDGFVCEV